MLQNVEFYVCPDGSINVKPQNEAMYVYTIGHRSLTQDMLALIRDLYPQAFVVLAEMYAKSQPNRPYYEYRIVHRFIRCNFGEYDTLSIDVANDGCLNLEEVHCPLRGECKLEGVLCKPRLETSLTERETEVAHLIAQGLTRQDVADELDISVYTVNRHVQNIKARLHLHTTAQLITRFNNR